MPNDDKRQRPSDKVDAVGMLFFGGLLTLWMLLLMSWGNGWPLRAVVPGTALAAVLTFVFYRHQLRPAAPFIDVRFLRANTAVCEIYAQYILVNAIHYSVLFGFPDYLQHERMMDARQAGWMMLFVAGFSLVLTPFIARWIERAGVKRPQLTGSVVMLCGTASMLTLHEQSSWLHMGAVLSLMGVSNGFHQLCLQTALYQEVPQSQTGAASGLFMTSRFVGTMLSASFLSLVFGGGTTMDGLHSLACICIILSIGVLVMSYRMRHSSYGEPAP